MSIASLYGSRPPHPLAHPRVWLVVLFLLATTLGSNAPPDSDPSAGGAPPTSAGDVTFPCLGLEPSKSPLPKDDLATAETAPAGAIPGSFAVSQTGSATYSIPLAVPPGRMGMEPNLSITYNSSAGEDFVGVGFALSGLSAITRCPANLAQDGLIRAVRYDDADRLCLDGARLVQVFGGGFELDGSGTREFRTIPDTHVKVVGHYGPGGRPSGAPDWFEVFTKSGRIIEYGSSGTARAMATNQVVAAWWVSKERDRRDNQIVYTYNNRQDDTDGHTIEIIPERIEYAHSADKTPTRAVVFQPTDATTPVTYFSGGMKLQRTKLLSRIEMRAGDGLKLVRYYLLAYKPGEGTKRPLLHWIDECAGAAESCKPATTFAWSSHAGQGLVKHVTTQMMFEPTGTRNGQTVWLMADVNGDGLEDLVFSRPSTADESIDQWWVALNNGGNFEAPTRWIYFTYPDSIRTQWSAVAIDYNQDGRADIFFDPPNGEWPTYRVLLSQPDNKFILHDTGIPRPPAVEYQDWERDNKIASHEFTRLGDVNGDGVADLIHCVNNAIEDDNGNDPDPHARWFVHLWSPDGEGPGIPGFGNTYGVTALPVGPLERLPCWLGLRWMHVVDVDGDGTSELVAPTNTSEPNYVAYKYTGSAWSTEAIGNLPTELNEVPFTPFTKLHWLDINADGLSDMIMTGVAHGCDSGFGTIVKWGCEIGHHEPPHQAMTADIPIRVTNTGVGFPLADFALSGTLVDTENLEWTDFYGDVATILDYNGDGRMDLLMPIEGHCGNGTRDPCWVVLQSSLSGEGPMVPIDTFIPVILHANGGPRPNYVVRVTDVDGDGRHDLVVPDSEDLTHFAVYKNDGPQDLLVSVTDGSSPLDPGEPGFIPTVEIYYDNLVDHAVTDGVPASSVAHDNLTYVAHSDPNNGCDYPRMCVVGPARVVGSYRMANGRNEARFFRVTYRDGRYHRLGRGFLGFGERTIIDADAGSGTVEQFDNIAYDPAWSAFPYAGQVVRAWAWTTEKPSLFDPGRVELTFTERTLIRESTNADQTYFTMPAIEHTMREEGVMQPGPQQSVVRFTKEAANAPLYVLGESWDEVNLHDEYGNSIVETHKAVGTDVTTSIVRNYGNDPASWLIGLLRYEQTCSAALGMGQCRTTTLERNAYGEVFAAWMGDPADPATHLSVGFVHDTYGHVVQTEAKDTYGHHRLSCVAYDDDRIFPFAARNGLGHTTYVKHDPGLGVTRAAVDPNGLVTRWRYDAFGRVAEEQRPDGGSTKVLLSRVKDGGPQGKWWNVKVTTRESGGAIRTTELDSLGRPVRSLTVAGEVEACGAAKCSPVLQLEEETTYDFLGRVERVSLPWMSGDTLTGQLHHEYAYDASGRLTMHVEPWGRVTTYEHAGRIDQATDWLGTSSVERDGLGRPVRVTDKLGNFTDTYYGPFGAVWGTVNFGGEISASERDALGRVVHQLDPDRGWTDVRYDGFGNALTVDDAQGRHYDFGYDALGRMVIRTDQDGETLWKYDAAKYGVGKLASVTNPASTKRYTYNELSQLSGVSLEVGSDVLEAQFGYDSVGRLRVVTYPQVLSVTPLVVVRDYDGYGNLVAVRDNAGGEPYWALKGVDGAGRPTGELFRNEAWSVRTFDPATGLVERIRTSQKQATAGSPLIQSLSYTYDKGLRMTSRADNLQVGPDGVRTELFVHDQLGRLTCSRFVDVQEGKDLRPEGPCELAIQYEPNGNIAHKSGVGAYTYDPNQPHAVVTAGASTFNYDAVGNQKARPGIPLISYTAFDLPQLLKLDGGDTVMYAYDGDQNRILKRVDGTQASETLYFEDLYERVTIDGEAPVHRYYVAAGSATAVIARRANVPDGSLAYLHTDALGSTDIVTDAAGKVTEQRSYDAFGARRNPKWGEPPPPAGSYGSTVSTVGFTGHEDEEDLGLTNMRGRIYDPKVGRFLQTDPIVSDPHFGQAWNPYSYVLNSPLNFVDPTGFQAWAPSTPEMPDGCDASCRYSAPDGKWYKTILIEESKQGRDHHWKQVEVEVNFKDAARDDKTSSRGPVEEPPTWRHHWAARLPREFARGAAGGLIPLGVDVDELATKTGVLPKGTTGEQLARAAGQLIGGQLQAFIGFTLAAHGGVVSGGSGGAALMVGAAEGGLGATLAVAGTQNAAKAWTTLMSKGSGGGKTARKANPDRVRTAKERLAQLEAEHGRLSSKPNKTPADKEELGRLDRAINKAKDDVKKSENHAQRGQGYR